MKIWFIIREILGKIVMVMFWTIFSCRKILIKLKIFLKTSLITKKIKHNGLTLKANCSIKKWVKINKFKFISNKV